MTDPALPCRLVTVSSRDYLPGTRVMLASFLAHNAWFDGRITVISDALDEADIAALTREFLRLEVVAPGAALVAAIAGLVEALPHLRNRARRFHSLDAFSGDGDEPVLFCDSDLLFCGDIAPFCLLPGPLIACPDRAAIMGVARDPVTLAEHGLSSQPGFTSFNAGLMRIDPTLANATVHAELLALLDPQEFAAIASDHTDQAVLNRRFGDAVALADPRFNRLVGHARKMRGAASVSISEAAVLHFNGAAKPWDFAHHPQPGAADPAFIKALERWFAAYGAFLSTQHFRGNG